MNMIKKIFLTDLKHLCSSFFVLVIAGGVAIIPALYAWMNIYSNWDPYGNTGNIKMAIVSNDEGYRDDTGEFHNTGSQVLESMKDNTAINWQFPKTEKEAIDGVKDGKYYGALVIPKGFTNSMYNVFLENVDRPSITFYQNQKMNPVANKITDTVVEKVQTNINNQFIGVLTETVFQDANHISEDLKKDGGFDEIMGHMTEVRDEMKQYQVMINKIVSSNAALTKAIDSADSEVSQIGKNAENTAKALDHSADNISKTELTIDSYTNNVNASLNTVQTTLGNMTAVMDSAVLSGDVKQMTDAAAKSALDAQTVYENLSALEQTIIAADGGSSPDAGRQMKAIKEQAAAVEKSLVTIATQYASAKTAAAAKQAEAAAAQGLREATTQVQNLQSEYNNTLMPAMKTALDSVDQTMTGAANVMRSMSLTVAGMGDVFGSLQLTIDSANTSLTNTSLVLDSMVERLDSTIDAVNEAKDDEKVKALINTLSGDPNLYASFFSSPVEIQSNVIYPVENYGSSVAPFYTTLAIWVGALILTAILKVNPNKKLFPDANQVQLFFGRYLTFLFMTIVQTTVTVLGDLYLLEIQCPNPFRFWVAGVITGLTFSILIYSLVVAFQDVGKALAVVMVVIQIAGSSGTYPIELLPEFFQRVYIFFPFPYAINAMRECIGGMYGHNYVFYLVELAIFIPVSLVVGLLLRKPLHGLTHYMEKRMRDTEMM
ncbi:MAG: YhgE/Pip domain-containing protein [Lachnospiraceae bacterium]|nr:YhgE/Pip domain-containing protein [Lachnospiraceae bacterium]